MATFKLRDLENYTITEGPRAANNNAASLRTIKSMRRTTALNKSSSMISTESQSAKFFDATADANNIALKSVVVELEDLIETTGEVQVEGVKSNESLLKYRLDKSTAATVDYGDKYRWPTSSRFTRDKYVDQLKLRVLGSVADRNVRVAKKLKRACTAAARRDDLSVGDDSVMHEGTPADEGEKVEGSLEDVWAESLRRVDAAIEASRGTSVDSEKIDQNAQSQLGTVLDALFPPSGQNIGRCMFTMKTVINTDVLAHVRSSMQASAANLETVVAEADAADAKLKQANEVPLDNDTAIANASSALAASVDAHERALRAIKDRLNQVLMDKTDDGNLRSTYDNAHTSISEWISEQHTNRTDLMTSAAADVKAITSVHTDRQSEHEKATEAYEAQQKQALANIEQLETMQEALWREVEERVQRIATISAERKVVVNDYLSRAEVEWKRRRYHDEFCAVHDAHRKSLELNGTLAMHSLDVLERLKVAVSALSERMESKDLHAGLDEFKINELNNFAKVYPRYGLAANRLMANLDARTVLANRSARIMQSSRDLAIASKDPDAQLLTARAETVTREASELESQSHKLATNIDYWHDVAVATEPKCNTFGIPLDVTHAAEDKVWHSIVQRSKQAVAADHQADTDGVAVLSDEHAKRQSDVEAFDRQTAERDANSPLKARKAARTSSRARSATPGAKNDKNGEDVPS